MVYRTVNSGYFYSSGAIAGSEALSSMALSPSYPDDKSILLGNQKAGSTGPAMMALPSIHCPPMPPRHPSAA